MKKPLIIAGVLRSEAFGVGVVFSGGSNGWIFCGVVWLDFSVTLFHRYIGENGDAAGVVPEAFYIFPSDTEVFGDLGGQERSIFTDDFLGLLVEGEPFVRIGFFSGLVE